MLSHSGSNASSNNLRRSKSSTSVRERRKHPLLPQSLDPSTARLHALIAAHKAMDRSSGSRSIPLARTDSSVTRRSHTDRGGQGVHFSSTFARGRQCGTLRSDTSYDIAGPRTAGTIDREAYLLEASTTVSEAGDFGENYGAQPSSYRRLKRAKSMLTPTRDRKHPHTSTASNTPFSQAPTLRGTMSTSSLRQSALRVRLRRSLNLLRPLSHTTSPQEQDIKSITYQPESIALARQQFLNDPKILQPIEKVSEGLRPRARREQKSLRKSLRSSFPQHDTGPTDDSVCEVSPVETKKRSISSSLRSRFFKTFGRKQISAAELPPQQMHASRAYFNKETISSNSEAGFDSYHDSDTGSVRRNSFYTPSGKHQNTSDDESSPVQQLRTSVSLESLHSTSRSRVTSWTNSTMTGSARETSYEKNRLSVIKEDGGPHQPSSSAGRHIGGVTAFQQPMPSCINGSIDSQRVYSALMKRIDQEQIEMEYTKRALDKIHEAEEPKLKEQPISFPTVRMVKSSLTSSHNPQKDELTQTLQESYSPLAENTDLNIHQFNEPIMQKTRKLQVPTTQSSFFPFSTTVKQESPSPFRKHLEERKTQNKHLRGDNVSVDSSNIVMHESEKLYASRGQLGRSSESIYSRNSDGKVNSQYRLPITSTDNLGLSSSQDFGDNGMATVMFSSYNGYDTERRATTRLPTAISATASEKGGWRGWAEHQMTALTRRGSKTSGHYREHAQIDSDNPHGLSDFGEDNFHYSQQGSCRDISGNGIIMPVSDEDTLVRPTRIEDVPLSTISTNILSAREQATNDKNRIHGQKFQPSNTANSLWERQPAVADENLKSTISRKISPDNIVNMLKIRKNRPSTIPRNGFDKENQEDTIVATTPISTPGRLQSQLRNGKTMKPSMQRINGQHAKGVQEHDSPLGARSSAQDSPSERFTSMLSARLSRPFDMDVPEHNRPFDSMYLGKREPGFAEILRGGRLSVAQHKSQLKKWKSYGGLGSEPFAEICDIRERHAEPEDTALPVFPNTENGEGRSTSLTGIASGSKRIVSNFLRSRKRNEDQRSEQLTEDGEGSRAFI